MPKVTFEVKKCHVCKAPCTYICKDCGKPVCGNHLQFSFAKDKEIRCTLHYIEYKKRYGDGLK